MKQKEVYIKSDAGVHARPAMMLVKEAMKYPCEIRLIKDGVEADCKSIMSVLGLAILPGSTLIVRAKGEDETVAVKALVDMIENNFVANEKTN